MFNLCQLVLVIRLDVLKRVDIELRDILMQSFDGGLRVNGFLIVYVSPVRYTGSI